MCRAPVYFGSEVIEVRNHDRQTTILATGLTVSDMSVQPETTKALIF